MDVEAIDNSKENIQPLKQGRKAAQLAFALQAQSDQDAQQQLVKERDKHELLIRMYDGPDPLQPRYDYVQWLEQYYPKHGRESNLTPLLEDTISNFKDDQNYKQDQRFIELVVKYIDSQQNALELYQLVYGLGIGTMCSIFYKAWAEELDRSNDLKRADQIYQLGIAARAQPVEMLRHAHVVFQLSVGRRMLQQGDWNDKEEPSTSSDDGPKRTTLGKLKKSAALSSYRPSKPEPGVVPLTACNRPTKNTPVQIYQDDRVDALGTGMQHVHLENFPRSKDSHRENTINPGPWNKSYNRKVTSYTLSSTPYSATKVQVYMDEEPESKASTPLPSTENALKPRKLDEITSCAMALFEPPDSSMMPMYCKQKVYAGGREFQLEEIRAGIYNKWFEAGLAKAPHAKQDGQIGSKAEGEATLPDSDEDEVEDFEREGRPENFSVFLDLRKTNPKFAPIQDDQTFAKRQGGTSETRESDGCFKAPFPVFCDDAPSSEESTSCVEGTCTSMGTTEGKSGIASFPVFCDDDHEDSTPLPEPSGLKNKPFPVFCDDDHEDSTPLPGPSGVKSKPFPVFCDDDHEDSTPLPGPSGLKNKPFPVYCDEDSLKPVPDYSRANSNPPPGPSRVKSKAFSIPSADDPEDTTKPRGSSGVKSKPFPVFCNDNQGDSKRPGSSGVKTKTFPVFRDDPDVVPLPRPSGAKSKAFPVSCNSTLVDFKALPGSSGAKTKPSKTTYPKDPFPVFCDDSAGTPKPTTGPTKVKSKATVFMDEAPPQEAKSKTAKVFPVFCDEADSKKLPPTKSGRKNTAQVFCNDDEPPRGKDGKARSDLPLHVKKSMFAKDHSRLPDSLL